MKINFIGTAEVGKCDGSVYSSANRPLRAETYSLAVLPTLNMPHLLTLIPCHSCSVLLIFPASRVTKYVESHQYRYCPFAVHLDQRVSILLHAILLLYQREIILQRG